MRKSPVIRSILALQFLMLLLLGITPKKGLHDIFARHQHQAPAAGGELQWQQGTFYCDIHNFVAKSPFEPAELPANSVAFVAPHQNFIPRTVTPVQKRVIAIENKGPPAAFL